MSNLDDLLNNQQKQSETSGKTWLNKLSNVYLWIGSIALILGFTVFFIGISDIEDKGEGIGWGIGVFFGGLFTIFMGCIGEAIDDIRNNTKK